MNNPKNIIVHHTAVSRTKNNNQFEATDNYHKSKGWGQIGYHYLIEPSGEVKQGRKDNEVGAHTSQLEMNYFSLGICLTGDFDIEEPTKEQIVSLKTLIQSKQKQYDIHDDHVYPHRKFATYKSCWGKLLPDDILTYLKMKTAPLSEDVSPWAVEAVRKAKAKGVMVNFNNPQAPMTDDDWQYVFSRLRALTQLDLKSRITREQAAKILDNLHLLD